MRPRTAAAADVSRTAALAPSAGPRLVQTKFRRQVPVGPYVADFVCFATRVVIEVDGGQHAIDRPADIRRDRWFAAQGFDVLRFWNNEVLDNLDGVLQTIADALAKQPPHPNPLPQGEMEISGDAT